MIEKDYRVRVTVKNNRILKAIERAGFTSIPAFCKLHGISYVGVMELIGLKTSPLKRDFSLKAVAIALCDALASTPDDLWSQDQIRPLEKNFSELEMSSSDVDRMLEGGGLEQNFHESFLKNDVLSALASLSDKEKLVIQMRYGFGEYDESSLEEVGNKLGVSKERVRQIEAKALRRFRNPGAFPALHSWGNK